MTIQQLRRLINEKVRQGGRRYINPIDYEVATKYPCEDCGGRTEGDGYKNDEEYRCYCMCHNCNVAYEF
jgi:hypothetical protein